MTEAVVPRDHVARIQVQCVACDPRRAQMVYWAVLSDGTIAEIGEADWVPDGQASPSSRRRHTPDLKLDHYPAGPMSIRAGIGVLTSERSSARSRVGEDRL